MRITMVAAVLCLAGGCGSSGTSSGDHQQPPVDHGPPSAVVASTALGTKVGAPVVLDASASTDPDGLALTFAWTVTSKPAGATPTLDGVATPKPTFNATVRGAYAVTVTVTATDGQSATAAVSVLVSEPSYIHLSSDAGDYIGAGSTYRYTKADAQITIGSAGGHLSVRVDGDENWTGDFQVPSSLSSFVPGTYAGLTRYPFDPTHGGLSWSGEGRGCNTLTGSFTVDAVTYAGGTLTAIDLRFEQHCEGGSAALRGEMHWDPNDTTAPPGPVDPVPAGLWRPGPGFAPPAGSYVHLESDFGDYIGAAGTYTYTKADAIVSVTATGNRLSVRVAGDEQWSGDFQAMIGFAGLQRGLYGNLHRYPFHNPARGGLDWSGEGRGCNTLSGWFAVDGVTYSSGTLAVIDLRFEQHCEGGGPALHGQIHWDASDTTMPPGPVDPPPPGLWQPGAGFTPPAGSYVHLESDTGDYIGAGGTFTYTPPDSPISVSAPGNRFSLGVSGWSGDFKAMDGLAQLQPGYYGNLLRYPFHNPARGGLDWSGQGRGCNSLKGWFVVDGVTWSGSTLTAIDLRFEQHCEGLAPALHGQIHWSP